MHRFLTCSLLFVIAVGLSHAQQDDDVFSNQDGFVFPGEADRPSKFPLNNTPRPTPPRPTSDNPRSPINPTSSIPGTTTNTPAFNQCLDNCQTTSEYNPVCGTNNVVYSNPGRLNCARSCGLNIDIKAFGQCSGNPRG